MHIWWWWFAKQRRLGPKRGGRATNTQADLLMMMVMVVDVRGISGTTIIKEHMSYSILIIMSSKSQTDDSDGDNDNEVLVRGDRSSGNEKANNNRVPVEELKRSGHHRELYYLL